MVTIEVISRNAFQSEKFNNLLNTSEFEPELEPHVVRFYGAMSIDLFDTVVWGQRLGCEFDDGRFMMIGSGEWEDEFMSRDQLFAGLMNEFEPDAFRYKLYCRPASHYDKSELENIAFDLKHVDAVYDGYDSVTGAVAPYVGCRYIDLPKVWYSVVGLNRDQDHISYNEMARVLTDPINF